MTTPAFTRHARYAGGGYASLMTPGAPHHAQVHDGGKRSLPLPQYMAELNARLRSHPMYLEGMHFPDPQPGSTPMLAAALAWEGPWDCLGVLSSVVEDVGSDYDLALPR